MKKELLLLTAFTAALCFKAVQESRTAQTEPAQETITTPAEQSPAVSNIIIDDQAPKFASSTINHVVEF